MRHILPRAFRWAGIVFRDVGSTTGRLVLPWYGTFREGKPPDVLQKTHHGIGTPCHIRNLLWRRLYVRMGGLQLGCEHYRVSVREDRLMIQYKPQWCEN